MVEEAPRLGTGHRMNSTLTTLAAAKRELRLRMLRSRDAVDPRVRARWSEEICRRVADSMEFCSAHVFLLFASFGSEVDTNPLLAEVCARGSRLVLPRVNRETRRLELREVSCLATDLAPGTWGIREPAPEHCREVPLDQIEFVLVPGVAFDRRLRRLGYGGGYYDRLLAGLPKGASAMGVCFAMQIVPEVPSSDHDIPVPILITESERIERP